MNGKTVYWHQAQPNPLVLVTGTEGYLASRAIAKIKQQLRSEFPELEITEVEEGSYSPGLLFNIAAPSLFAEPRLILIQGGSDGLLDDLLRFSTEPVESCYVIVRIPNAVGHNGKIKQGMANKPYLSLVRR